MPKSSLPVGEPRHGGPRSARDRFDEVPRAVGRVGAHRAENPGMNVWIVLLWSFVGTTTLFIAGTFGALVLMGRIALP